MERPWCNGLCGGSGGHLYVIKACARPADWWHPDDPYSFCSEHVGAWQDQYWPWGPFVLPKHAAEDIAWLEAPLTPEERAAFEDEDTSGDTPL